MATSTIRHPSAAEAAAKGSPQRLLVHSSGEKAGLMQVEAELPEELKEDAANSDVIELAIPGEVSPLKPLDVNDADKSGRQVISFFSADIANAGHLPAAATLSMTMADGSSIRTELPCVAVEVAEHQTTGEAAAAAETYPIDRYPRTVGVVALIALAVGLLLMSLLLLSL